MLPHKGLDPQANPWRETVIQHQPIAHIGAAKRLRIDENDVELRLGDRRRDWQARGKNSTPLDDQITVNTLGANLERTATRKSADSNIRGTTYSNPTLGLVANKC